MPKSTLPKKRRKAKLALREFTRQHIRDAVARVITHVGVHGLTMDRIAEEAGIAKGTLYRHFKTKNDLIRDTIEVSLAPMIAELTELAKENLPPGERLRRMTLRHVSFFEEHRPFFRVLLHERSRVQVGVRRQRSSLYRRLVESTTEVIEEGIKTGVFRPVDPAKLGAMVIDGNIAVISHRLLNDQPGPVEDDAALLSNVLMRGIERTPRHEPAGETT